MTLLVIAVLWHPARLLFHFGAFKWHLFTISIIASIFTIIVLETVKLLFFKRNNFV